MNMIIQEEKLKTLLLKDLMIIPTGQLFLMIIVEHQVLTNQIQVLVLECQQVITMMKKV